MSKAITRDKIIRKEIREADGARYCYRLVMSESNKVASYKLPLYSIEIEMTDEEKIDFVATRVLKKYRAAFEELAK